MIKNPKDFTPEQRNILSQMGISPEGRPEIGVPMHTWAENVQMVQNRKRERPVASPVAAGTKTQRRIEAEEQARQFNEQMALQRAQLAEARRARAASPVSGPVAFNRNDAMQSIRTLVNEAVRRGEGWAFVESRIIANAGKFDKNTMVLDEAIQVAFQHYKNSAYTPTGELRPVTRDLHPSRPIHQIIPGRFVQVPGPQEDILAIYHQLFPEQADRGGSPFYPAPEPIQPESNRVWWNPATWFR